MSFSPVSVSFENGEKTIDERLDLRQISSVTIYNNNDPDPLVVVVAENNSEKKQSQRLCQYGRIRTVEHTYPDGSRRVSWIGTIMSTPISSYGFATIVQMPNGQLVGSFTTETESHTLINSSSSDGSMQMQSHMWEQVQNISMGQGIHVKDPEKTDSNTLFTEKEEDISVAESTMVTSIPIRIVSEDSSDETNMIQGPTHRQRRQNFRRVQNSPENNNNNNNTIIDLLMIVTNRAMCEAANQNAGCPYNDDNAAAMLSRIALGEAQTNAAMQLVGVSVEIRWVQVIFLDATSGDLPANEQSLIKLFNSRTVQQWRDDYGADLVAAIGAVDPVTPICGMAYIFNPISITAWNSYCFNIYTITHEM
jgi:hypothetical protein